METIEDFVTGLAVAAAHRAGIVALDGDDVYFIPRWVGDATRIALEYVGVGDDHGDLSEVARAGRDTVRMEAA